MIINQLINIYIYFIMLPDGMSELFLENEQHWPYAGTSGCQSDLRDPSWVNMWFAMFFAG